MTDDDHFKRFGRDAELTIYVVGQPGVNRVETARAVQIFLDQPAGKIRYFTGMFDHVHLDANFGQSGSELSTKVIIGGIGEVFEERVNVHEPIDLKSHRHTFGPSAGEATGPAEDAPQPALPQIGDVIRCKPEHATAFPGFSPEKTWIVTKVEPYSIIASERGAAPLTNYIILHENLPNFEWFNPFNPPSIVIEPTAEEVAAFKAAWAKLIIPSNAKTKVMWAGDVGEITITPSARTPAEAVARIREIIDGVLEPKAPI